MRLPLAQLGAMRLIGSKVTLFAVGTATIILTLTVFPSGRGSNIVQNPAADAEAAYQSLLVQMDSRDIGAAAAHVAPPPTPRGAGMVESTGGLRRNLFAPVRGRLESVNTPSRPSTKAAKPNVPALTGVFIDGGVRQARLAGVLVSEGDVIRGYLVLEITSEWVLLEKDGVTYKLPLGGDS